MEDLDAERAVLGDELLQRGDPQGELIGLQLALEALLPTAPPARRNLIERKISTLLDQHHDAFYGALAPDVMRLSRPDLEYPALLVKRWRGGFADTIWLQRTPTTPLAEVVRAMRALPIARFVRRIELAGGDHRAGVEALEPLPALRELVLDSSYRGGPQVSTVRLASTRVLDPLLARLEVLLVKYAVDEVAPLASSTLRELELYVSNQPFTPPTRTFDAELPVLDTLTCSGFRMDAGFLARYPALRHLAVHTALEPGWFEHHLLRSPALGRLETLAITWLGDPELALIVQHADRLANLAQLNLAGNYFTPQGLAAAAGRLPVCVRFR